MNLWIYRLINIAAVAATIGPWLVTKEMNGFSYCVSLAGLITVDANSRLRKKYTQGLDRQLIGFVSFLVGLALVIVPWVLSAPKIVSYLLFLPGLVLLAIIGYGAQMEQLGKGNTGEDLLKSIWTWLKIKLKRNSA